MLARYRLAAAAMAAAALVAGVIVSVSVSGTARAGMGDASPAAASAAVAGTTSTQQCTGHPVCQFAEEIKMPLAIAITAASSGAGQHATVAWTVSCQGGGAGLKSSAGSTAGATPLHVKLALPKSEGADCTLNATITLTGSGSVTGALVYTQGVQVMTSVPTGDRRPGAPLATFKCLTDYRDSHKSGAKLIRGDCSYTNASTWTFDGKHLLHSGMCLTDPRNGGSRTKVVLSKCTKSAAADQTWSYRSGGQLVLRAHSGHLCLDDPKPSLSTGTPIIVFSCNGGATQQWTIQ